VRDGELGIRANFQKRYITLAPVAGVVGVGFDLKDPKGLLGCSGEQVNSSVVKCLWEVFVWGFGALFLSCVCVSVSGVLFSVGVELG